MAESGRLWRLKADGSCVEALAAFADNRARGNGETLPMVELDSISSPNTHMLLPSGILLPRKLEAALRGWKVIPAPKWSTLQPALVMVSKVLN